MAERPMYPSNSYSDREPVRKDQKEAPKKIEPVAQGKVRKGRKSLARKIFETLIVEDLRTIESHIIDDILVPEIQKALVETIRSSAEMMFGQSSKGRSAYERSPEYTSYSKCSSTQSPVRTRPEARKRYSGVVDDITLPTKMVAEEALDRMYELLNHYDCVSVADYYAIVGVTSNYTDNDYGWVDLRGAHVMKVSGGYILSLPRPVVLSE